MTTNTLDVLRECNQLISKLHPTHAGMRLDGNSYFYDKCDVCALLARLDALIAEESVAQESEPAKRQHGNADESPVATDHRRALQACYDWFEDHYDGAPDSPTRHMAHPMTVAADALNGGGK